jgi:uncharacterized protein DUF3276
MGLRGEVYSWRVTSANDRRTYFVNLKENRTGDLYMEIVESKKHGEAEFERRQIMVFEEDFGSFQVGMEKTFDFIRDRKGGKKWRPPKAEKSGDE